MGHAAIFLTSMQIGGAERIALNLCRGLSENGHDVDLVLVHGEGELLGELPSSVSVVDLGASRVLTGILPLRRYLRQRKPDVLYSMMTEINVAAIVAHELAQSNSRLVISEHNTPSVSKSGPKDGLVLRTASLLYSRADRIITVSRGVRDDLVTVTGVSDEDVTVIYNPIDVEQIRRQAEEPIDHDWINDPETPVVMSAGRHAPQKGFDTLLRAFDQLETADVKLILLGEGNETASLRSLARELGIEDRVDFPGFVDNPFSYMRGANVFVLSSWYEGFGNVLIEAMATGCPVVSTDCPSGPNEILDGGRYGPLIPVKHPDQMVVAIDNVLRDPIDADVLVDRADDFSVDSVTEQYEDVLFGR